jgi:hypothetical protein
MNKGAITSTMIDNVCMTSEQKTSVPFSNLNKE